MKKYILIIITIFYSFACARTPRVSIITSIYDGDNFIEGFLADIVQTTIFDQCELILINANSPGNEEPIIKKYLNKRSNIIYKRLTRDPGLYAVWNMAIKMARAPLITNANIDDRRNPEAIEALARVLEQDQSVDLVYSAYIKTTEPNRCFEKYMKSLPYNQWKSQNLIIDPPPFKPSNMNRCLPGPFPMWRKSIHTKIGYFNEYFRVAGDYEMWLRAVHNGMKFKKISTLSGVFYSNPNGISQKKNFKKNEGTICDQYSYLWNQRK